MEKSSIHHDKQNRNVNCYAYPYLSKWVVSPLPRPDSRAAITARRTGYSVMKLVTYATGYDAHWYRKIYCPTQEQLARRLR